MSFCFDKPSEHLNIWYISMIKGTKTSETIGGKIVFDMHSLVWLCPIRHHRARRGFWPTVNWSTSGEPSYHPTLWMDGWTNEKAARKKAPLDLMGSTRSIKLWVNKIQCFPLSINRFNKYHGSPWVKMIIWPVDGRKCSKIFNVLLGLAVLLKFMANCQHNFEQCWRRRGIEITFTEKQGSPSLYYLAKPCIKRSI